jgi:hypothetical protein
LFLGSQTTTKSATDIFEILKENKNKTDRRTSSFPPSLFLAVTVHTLCMFHGPSIRYGPHGRIEFYICFCFFFLAGPPEWKDPLCFPVFFSLSPYWWLENQLLKYIFFSHFLVGLILLSCVIAALKAFHLSRCIGISFLTNTFLRFFFLYIFDLIIVREHEELRRRARTYPTTY